MRDGIDGFVVPIRDPESITARLLQLYADRGLLKQMSDAARERAKTLDWQGYKGRIVSAVRDAVDLRGLALSD